MKFFVFSSFSSQLLVMNETFIINDLKEKVCFVSKNFDEDMKMAKSSSSSSKNPNLIDFVLPDFNDVKDGFVLSDVDGSENSRKTTNKQQQIVRMNVERFTIPEILFRPSIIGIDQAGIAESIYNSVEQLPEHIRPSFYNNILLIGGNSRLKNFRERLEDELRSLIPSDYPIRITLPDDPITFALNAGVSLSQTSYYNHYSVTKREYDEHGESICHRKFSK